MKKIKFVFVSLLCFIALISCDSKTLSFYKDCAGNKVDAVRETVSKNPALAMSPLTGKDVEAFASYAYLEPGACNFRSPLEIVVKLGHKDVMRILYMEMSRAGYNFSEDKALSGELLRYAVKEKDIGMLKELLSIRCSTDAEAGDGSGDSIVSYLFASGEYDMVEEFFKSGASVWDVSARNIFDALDMSDGGKGLSLLAKYADYAGMVDVKFMREIKLDKPRMNGDDVKLVQEVLCDCRLLEYEDIDGYFGPVSEGAVQAFTNWFGFPFSGTVDEEMFKFMCGIRAVNMVAQRIDVIR